MDDFVFRLLALGELQLMLIALSFFALGFVLTLIVNRGRAGAMRRVPYFIWLCATSLALTAATALFLMMPEAIEAGRLWQLALGVCLALFAGGAVSAFLAQARSVSGYGHDRRAWMALVPLVNLVLLFKRPRDWARPSWRRRGLHLLGLVFGLLLIAAGGVLRVGIERALEVDAARMRGTGVEAELAPQAVGLDRMLREQGLEATLRAMAAGAPETDRGGELHLDRIEAEGPRLRYVYVVAPNVAELPFALRRDLLAQTCATAELRPLMEAGAVFEHVFLDRLRLEIGRVEIARGNCAY